MKRRNRPARKHSPEQIRRLVQSIRSFGFLVPVVADRHGFLICGHARLEAAIALGLDEIPVVIAEDLTEEEARAYAIADNRLAELSSWDDAALRAEIADLVALEVNGDLGFDLDVLAFETAELDVILTGGESGTDAKEQVELPAEGQRAVARRDEIWQLGAHRILCADALDTTSYDRLLGSELVPLCMTDQPFNVPIHGHVSGSGRHREFAMASGELSPEAFREFLRRSLEVMAAHVGASGLVYAFMDWRHIADLIRAGEEIGLILINLCVWSKSNAGMGSFYRSQHELICVFRKGVSSHRNNIQLGRFGRSRSNVWSYAGVNTFRRGRGADLADHPTVKPTPMLMDAIRDVTRHGEVVLDPFGGSGSTLLAAEKTGRRARLIEIDPLYVDVAIRRWQRLTGWKAVEAETGERWDDRAAAMEAGEHAVAAPAGKTRGVGHEEE